MITFKKFCKYLTIISSLCIAIYGVRDLFSLGGTHIFGMFCPNRRIHARIRASPENLAGRRGLVHLFFSRVTIFLFQYRHRGTCMQAPNIPDNIILKCKKKEEKKVALIFARIMPKFSQDLCPKFYIGNFFFFFFFLGGQIFARIFTLAIFFFFLGGGGAECPPAPPPPPSRTPRLWVLLLLYTAYILRGFYFREFNNTRKYLPPIRTHECDLCTPPRSRI